MLWAVTLIITLAGLVLALRHRAVLSAVLIFGGLGLGLACAPHLA